MERIKRILHASLLCRALAACCRWIGGQWRSSRVMQTYLPICCDWIGRQWSSSRVVQAYLSPSDLGSRTSRSSVFALLWDKLHGLICWFYDKLRLEKLVSGSILTQLWFWCALTIAMSPLLPTMVTAGLACVCFVSLLLAFARNRARQLQFTPINKYILLYAAVYAVGTAASVSLADSLLIGLLTILFTLFALIPINAVDSRPQLVKLVRVLVLAGAVVSLIGLFQYIFRTGYQSAAWVDSSMFGGISFRVVSTFDNPNMLGQYLVLMIPLSVACLMNDYAVPKLRWLWMVCCGLMCMCMLLTFSRGGWLALLLALLVFFVMLNPRLLMLAPVALLVLYLVLPDTIIQRFTSIGNLSDRSTSYRVFIWLGSLRMLADYWLCGIGPGPKAFNTVYPLYSYDEIVTPHTHNLLLQITSDAGVCALILFCVILWVFVRRMCAAIHVTVCKTGKLLQIAFLSGVAGFMVQAMTDYSFYNYRVMFLFWVYLALGMLAANWNHLRTEEPQ